MMIEMTRPYIYKGTYDIIMKWGRKAVESGIIARTPNNKDNFPYYLSEFVKLRTDEPLRKRA